MIQFIVRIAKEDFILTDMNLIRLLFQPTRYAIVVIIDYMKSNMY